MIRVNLYKKGDFIIKYESLGHSDSAERGYDIICAGVSILDYSVANAIKYKLGIETKILIDDGKFILEFVNEDDAKRARDALLVYEVGIQNLVDEYPEFVSMEIKED